MIKQRRWRTGCVSVNQVPGTVSLAMLRARFPCRKGDWALMAADELEDTHDPIGSLQFAAVELNHPFSSKSFQQNTASRLHCGRAAAL